MEFFITDDTAPLYTRHGGSVMFHTPNSSDLASGRRPEPNAVHGMPWNIADLPIDWRSGEPSVAVPGSCRQSKSSCHAMAWSMAGNSRYIRMAKCSRLHGRSTHLHVFVEPHAPRSHDHMILCMWHAGVFVSLLDLPTLQESSAASHKCHFRVRHFRRVFDSPYKK